jgi:hypothetical protein
VWAVAAGILALPLMPRPASACSCGPGDPRMISPSPGGAGPAALPLLIMARPDAPLQIEDAAGQPIPLRRVLTLPMLGLCATRWFFISPEEQPWSPGHYRLVRGPDDADTFELTAGDLAPADPVDVSVTLAIEANDPLLFSSWSCADPKVLGRMFPHTAHLSFDASASVGAPLFATAVVADPNTPGGLAQSNSLGWLAGSAPIATFDLPLAAGVDPCAAVMMWDRAGALLLADTLCATTSSPATISARVRPLRPAGSPLVDRGFGCSAAGAAADPRASMSVLLLSAALAFVRIWRKPRTVGRMLRACRPGPTTNTRTG